MNVRSETANLSPAPGTPTYLPWKRRSLLLPEILRLKTRWVPLLLIGTVLLAAAGGILLVLAYRWLQGQFGLTDRFFSFWRDLPAQSLALNLGIVLGVLGLALTLYALNRIRTSEIGHIRSLWWKLAIALFATRWWFRDPQVVVIGSGEDVGITIRALKGFVSSVTAMVPAPHDGWEAWQPYFRALAAREKSLEDLLAWEVPHADDAVTMSDLIGGYLRRVNGSLPVALSTLSQALAVEGAIVPLLPEAPVPTSARIALREADAIFIGSGKLEDVLPTLDSLAEVLHASPAKILLIAPIVMSQREGGATSLGELVEAVHQATGGPVLDAVLANTNFAPSLPDPDLIYPVVDVPALRAQGVDVVACDLVEWSAPTRYDRDKLAVWLQDYIAHEAMTA